LGTGGLVVLLLIEAVHTIQDILHRVLLVSWSRLIVLDGVSEDVFQGKSDVYLLDGGSVYPDALPTALYVSFMFDLLETSTKHQTHAYHADEGGKILHIAARVHVMIGFSVYL
jgi:hypothetical protein